MKYCIFITQKNKAAAKAYHHILHIDYTCKEFEIFFTSLKIDGKDVFLKGDVSQHYSHPHRYANVNKQIYCYD